jgi:ornithine carbamoyltransferase
MDVRIAAPESLWPTQDLVAHESEIAAASGARITITEDVEEAVRGCDMLLTDLWVSIVSRTRSGRIGSSWSCRTRSTPGGWR